ncbi:MAG: hypothetical protein J6127_06540 [Clostridiales bacterium]|nr:hypothetical protein [Clostridiales bacterium]
MKKYIEAYMSLVREFMNNEMSSADKARFDEVLKEFEIKISYFQHERFIHLIVTVLFAILEMMSIYAFLMTSNITVLAFCILFLVLLVPYVMHYYFLENSVQEMYKMRDEIVASSKKNRE